MLYSKKWDLDAAQLRLHQAAAYMEHHGWCQKQVSDSAGRVCLLGAVVNCQEDHANLTAALDRLTRYLGGSIPLWNDDPCRTKDEAVAVLIAAAK